MMIATILDSFCINNYESLFGYNICFSKIVGMNTFFIYDLPQVCIHLYFMLFYPSHKIPHNDLTVELSLISSVLAVPNSFFNTMASHPNYFDPRLLEFELIKKQNHKKDQLMIQDIKEEF
jgi:hypothetical protein